MNLNVIIEIITALFLLLGTSLALLSAIGILRLPDIYTRSHAGTKSATLGVLCTLMGTFIFFAGTEQFISIRLLLGILFVFLTAPVAGHLLCRAAYHSDVAMSNRSVLNELKNVIHVKKEK
ncbi:monovalent cation/H(+) antiporter subunit G [Sinobaca sp. H24]|uniref:monovalent cation/H(+) antiporter subunit G n=1 Tax=Sinobaca sp. H24 TaxID=2923376 RepID=UPI00207A7405|nr:monovalent cation/H(+) antiporter subunit G [Sinobaca sp. H24]